MTHGISQRKADHLSLAASGEAEFRSSTLLENVHLVHQALPESSLDEVDLGVELAGLRLAAPVVVSGMTGGTEEAGALNRALAQAAQARGLAFGLGSQRAMVLHPELAATFRVREAAPDVILFGNLGVVQAREMGAQRVRALAEDVGASALCIHLNPAMELIQHDGDRDFRGCIDLLGELAALLTIPVIAKETGCGLSSEAAVAIRRAGVKTVDVSGAGGTSWVGVETLRAEEGSMARSLGDSLWDWGVPTAVSVAACAREGLEVIATGGLRTGVDVARAIALGARAGGLAAPVLRAYRTGGHDGALRFLDEVIAGVRTVALLCGRKRVLELASAPRVIAPPLRDWLADLGLWGVGTTPGAR